MNRGASMTERTYDVRIAQGWRPPAGRTDHTNADRRARAATTRVLRHAESFAGGRELGYARAVREQLKERHGAPQCRHDTRELRDARADRSGPCQHTVFHERAEQDGSDRLAIRPEVRVIVVADGVVRVAASHTERVRHRRAVQRYQRPSHGGKAGCCARDPVAEHRPVFAASCRSTSHDVVNGQPRGANARPRPEAVPRHARHPAKVAAFGHSRHATTSPLLRHQPKPTDGKCSLTRHDADALQR